MHPPARETIAAPEQGALRGRSRNVVLAMVVTLTLCMWIAAGLWIWSEHNGVLESNARVLEQLSVAIREQSHGLFKQAETTLIVARQWIVEHPKEDPGTAPGFIALIDQLRKTSGGMLDLRMVTHDGVLRYIPDRGQANHTNVSDRDYFLAQRDPKTRGLFIAAPVKSRVTHKWGIPISLPVDGGSGNVGVLFVAIELDRLEQAIEATRPKHSGSVALFRADGTTIFRLPVDERQIGKSIADSDSWRDHLSKRHQGSFESTSSPIDGIQRQVAFARVAEYPLLVAVTVAKRDLLVHWTKDSIALLLVIAALTTGLLFLSHILVKALDAESGMRIELSRLMLTDSLTGTGNRRMIMQSLEKEIQRSRRYQRPLTLVFVDIDHFKKVNDEHGHAVGDVVLTQVAQCIGKNLRTSDHYGRYGGEEFVIVLSETPLSAAYPLVERMRQEVSNIPFPQIGRAVSISAGVAQMRESETLDELLRRSDAALYQAKSSGRNRIWVDAANHENFVKASV
jgi:diguanylate cyclase (GGDEF)-like protein